MTLGELHTLYADLARTSERDQLFSQQVYPALLELGCTEGQASRILTHAFQVANRTRIRGNYADMFRFMAEPLWIVVEVDLEQLIPRLEAHTGPYPELVKGGA